MTFDKLTESLIDLKAIAANTKEKIASEKAKQLLKLDVTTHNVSSIEPFLESYFRNR